MTCRIFIALLISWLIPHIAVSAQNIEAYSNQSNKRDTLISFGATSPFVSVSRTLWVYNGTTSDIRMKPSLTDIKGAVSDVMNEFGGLFANEVVQAGQTRPFTVLYKADFNAFPVDSLAEARFLLDIEDAVTQRQLVRKVFILSGIKTNNLLGTNTRVVNFDSVFISSNCASNQLFTIQSVVDVPVSVLTQTLRRTTPSLGNVEFSVDTFPSVEFAGKSAVTWTMRYAPADTGYDAAEFAVTYRNPNLVSDSSLRVALRGVGVRHAIRPLQTLVLDGSSILPKTNGDTIEIGEIPQDRDSVVFGVVFRNEGNVDVSIDSVRLGSASLAFYLKKHSSRHVRAMGLDTVQVVYKPTSSDRVSTVALQIWTDIEKRGFSCTPFNAGQSTITVIGRNKARASFNIDTLDFGSIERPRACTFAVTKQFVVQNFGSGTCTIDSAMFDPQDEGISLKTTLPQSIRADASYVLECTLTPQRLGVLRGTIRLWISTAQRVIELPYRANVVAPDSLHLGIESEIHASPGRIIEVPITWAAVSANRIQRAEIGIDVNPTILRYVGFVTEGTACSRALVTATSSARGVRVVCTDDAGLVQRDTLLKLRFQTFLGDSAQSNIVVLPSATSLGTMQCPDTYPSVIRHGRFVTDSLCGLSYKTNGMVRGLRASAFPNPANDALRIVVMDDIKGLATIDVVDAYGRSLQTLTVPDINGVETVPMDVSALPCGHYTCIVQCGVFIVHVPIAVTR